MLMIIRVGCGLLAGYISRGYLGFVVAGFFTGIYMSACLVSQNYVAFLEFAVGALLAAVIRLYRELKRSREVSSELVQSLVNAKGVSEREIRLFEEHVDKKTAEVLREYSSADAE